MTTSYRPALRLLVGFARAEGAATAIEYALIAGMLSIAIAAAAALVGQTLTDLYAQVVAGLS